MSARPLFNVMRACALSILILLTGCAAQRAHDEGQELLRTGKTQEGLLQLQEATRLEPRNAEYRLSYLRARDEVIARLLDRADVALESGALENAAALLRELLVLDPRNARARTGLLDIQRRRERDQLFQEAQAAAKARDPQLATSKLRQLLMANPGDSAAVQLLAEIEAANAAKDPEAELSAAYRKPITLEFKDTPIKTVFEVLSRSSGLNFLFDKDVKTDAKTSIFLRNSTVESAVRLILLTNQLDQRVIDANTVLVYPNTPAKQKEYQPLSVRSFYLANARAKEVASTLKSILKTRDVVVDEKLNLVIMRDSPQAIRLAEKLVALHDVPEPEVMLEVEILEVTRSRLVELGVRWPDQLTLSPLAAEGGDALSLDELLSLDQTSVAATVSPAVARALQDESDTNILANPRIRARNHEEAKILIGERVPNITTTATSTGFVSESVTYVDVGLKLDVQPTIYPDNEVAIEVALEVSNIISQIQTKSGSLAYQIGTRTATTVLRLKDGENQVLAGLINDEDRRTSNGVPGLSKLPLLGRLFGNKASDKSKTEIVLSITPRIIRNMRRPDISAIEFDSGTESSLTAGLGGGGGSATSNVASTTSERPAASPSGGNGDQTTPTDPGRDMNSTGQALGPGVSNPSFGDSNGGGGAVPAAALRWQGPENLNVGDTFSLQLLMQSDQPVVSIPLAVGFDPRMLQVTSVLEGDFLREGGAPTSFTSRVDENGQIIVTATRTGDTGATRLGSVATFNFRVTGAVEPEAMIQLLAISPVALGGSSVNAPLPLPHVIAVGR